MQSIPKSFLKYLREDDKKEGDEKIAILRNYKVDDYLWIVKVGYFDDHKLHFKEGWNKFCNDHGLHVGDFLVFQHHQNLVFDVFVFDPTACERPFPGLNHLTSTKNVGSSSSNIPLKEEEDFSKPNGKGLKRTNRDRHKVNPGSSKIGFKSRGYPHFHTTVKLYWLKRGGMHIPLKFARENNIANRKCNMIVIDEQGDEWVVPLRQHKRGNSVYIGKLRDFYVANDLKPGQPVVFELIASANSPKFIFYKNSS
ncbi:B3 domain-containing protein REM9-like [Spinacia oleracea]|uniref:B3 domain-containing protein REM9-like n=1 Tax=Spinacia oleracea TaxID=3562 RepID=A0ABM3RNJ9_SPIOL|nr:B3 domain-containing protein REM9-like [Spinacia oleracea]